jgi:hypothetical protein
MSDVNNKTDRKRSRLLLVLASAVLLPVTYVLVEGPLFAIVELNPTTRRALPVLLTVYTPLSRTFTAIDGGPGEGPAWAVLRAYERFWKRTINGIAGASDYETPVRP